VLDADDENQIRKGGQQGGENLLPDRLGGNDRATKLHCSGERKNEGETTSTRKGDGGNRFIEKSRLGNGCAVTRAENLGLWTKGKIRSQGNLTSTLGGIELGTMRGKFGARKKAG